MPKTRPGNKDKEHHTVSQSAQERNLWDPVYREGVGGNPGSAAQYQAYLQIATRIFGVKDPKDLTKGPNPLTQFKNLDTFRSQAKRAAETALKFETEEVKEPDIPPHPLIWPNYPNLEPANQASNQEASVSTNPSSETCNQVCNAATAAPSTESTKIPPPSTPKSSASSGSSSNSSWSSDSSSDSSVDSVYKKRPAKKPNQSPKKPNQSPKQPNRSPKKPNQSATPKRRRSVSSATGPARKKPHQESKISAGAPSSSTKSGPRSTRPPREVTFASQVSSTMATGQGNVTVKIKGHSDDQWQPFNGSFMDTETRTVPHAAKQRKKTTVKCSTLGQSGVVVNRLDEFRLEFILDFPHQVIDHNNMLAMNDHVHGPPFLPRNDPTISALETSTKKMMNLSGKITYKLLFTFSEKQDWELNVVEWGSNSISLVTFSVGETNLGATRHQLPAPTAPPPQQVHPHQPHPHHQHPPQPHPSQQATYRYGSGFAGYASPASQPVSFGSLSGQQASAYGSVAPNGGQQPQYFAGGHNGCPVPATPPRAPPHPPYDQHSTPGSYHPSFSPMQPQPVQSQGGGQQPAQNPGCYHHGAHQPPYTQAGSYQPASPQPMQYHAGGQAPPMQQHYPAQPTAQDPGSYQRAPPQPMQYHAGGPAPPMQQHYPAQPTAQEDPGSYQKAPPQPIQPRTECNLPPHGTPNQAHLRTQRASNTSAPPAQVPVETVLSETTDDVSEIIDGFQQARVDGEDSEH